MSKYPEDIMKAAREAVSEAIGGYKSLDEFARPTADAILSERERCCKVAAHFTGSLWTAEQNIVAQMILDNLRDGSE